MYENATVKSDLVYESAWGDRLEDIVHNVGVFRALITDAVNERGRPSAGLLHDMFDRHRVLTATECKANGLIDDVVPLAAAFGMPATAAGARRRADKT